MRAERPADLHRAHRATGGGAAAEVVNELAGVGPIAFSTRPPCFTLPPSWNATVPRERPTP